MARNFDDLPNPPVELDWTYVGKYADFTAGSPPPRRHAYYYDSPISTEALPADVLKERRPDRLRLRVKLPYFPGPTQDTSIVSFGVEIVGMGTLTDDDAETPFNGDGLYAMSAGAGSISGVSGGGAGTYGTETTVTVTPTSTDITPSYPNGGGPEPKLKGTNPRAHSPYWLRMRLTIIFNGLDEWAPDGTLADGAFVDAVEFKYDTDLKLCLPGRVGFRGA